MPQQAETNEASVIFGSLNQSQEQAARTAYEQHVMVQLQGLTAAVLLPPSGTVEPRCTDVQGVLQRIAENAAAPREIAILLTDLHESCTTSLTPVNVSAQAPTLIVLLLPERAKGAGTSTAHDLYAQRRAEVQRIFPGALAIPHFGDVVAALKQAALSRATASGKRTQ